MLICKPWHFSPFNIRRNGSCCA